MNMVKLCIWIYSNTIQESLVKLNSLFETIFLKIDIKIIGTFNLPIVRPHVGDIISTCYCIIYWQ